MKRANKGRELVRRVVLRLQTEYHPGRVILFGSYAWGRPTRESDLDVLIVKQTTKPFYQRLFEVRQLVSPLLRGHPFDPIVLTPQELKRRLARGDQFLQRIVTRGRSMHGHAD